MTSVADWNLAPPPGRAAPLAAVDAYRVTQGDDEVRVEARFAIRHDEETLRGHFPGLPIYPGVFVVESVLQAVALAYGRPARLRELRSIRFLAPLLAGDELRLDVRIRGEVAKGGCARQDGATAVQLTAVVDV